MKKIVKKAAVKPSVKKPAVKKLTKGKHSVAPKRKRYEDGGETDDESDDTDSSVSSVRSGMGKVGLATDQMRSGFKRLKTKPSGASDDDNAPDLATATARLRADNAQGTALGRLKARNQANDPLTRLKADNARSGAGTSALARLKAKNAGKSSPLDTATKPARTSAPASSKPAASTSVKTKGGDYPVYKKDSAEAEDFGKTFAAKRAKYLRTGKAEDKNFTWNGRSYSTDLKK